MKLQYYALAILLLSGCNPGWKAYENRSGLLAEPVGFFQETSDGVIKNVCDLEKVKVISSDLDTKELFVQTKFVESGVRSTFMKLTTEIKSVNEGRIISTINISNVEGFDIGDVTLEETCEASGEANLKCSQTGHEGAPVPVYDFSDCYINARTSGKKTATHGIYNLKNRKEINALHTTVETTGHIFCAVEGEKKSVGNGTITLETYSSPDIVALPGTDSDCNGSVFFMAKTVVLENGKKIEYVRHETVEAPLKGKINEKLNP